MEAGRLEESIAEHEGMLELNPNDNQGVRYGLLALYLALKRLDGASRPTRLEAVSRGSILDARAVREMRGVGFAGQGGQESRPHANGGKTESSRR